MSSAWSRCHDGSKGVVVAKAESEATVLTPQVLQAWLGQRRADPGPLYWASAAAMACAAAAPFPFFWAPPLWVAFLLAPPQLPALVVLGTVLRGLEPARGSALHTPAECPDKAQQAAPRTGATRVHVASQGGCGDEVRTRVRPVATVQPRVRPAGRRAAERAAGRAHREPSAPDTAHTGEDTYRVTLVQAGSRPDDPAVAAEPKEIADAGR
jgi:hypothetical protein